MALFAFEELTFRYPEAPRDALRDVSVAIEPGQFVLVCGQSGCGKTTLLRQFKSALAPHGHQSGQVLFDGVPLADVPEREQVARIGFVMQDPDAQIVTDKVWHELAFVLESLGCDERTMRLRVAEMASYFGIQHWFHKNVGELSGGQKQLLNLASVMAARPDVLVLDEPTSQLDPIAASDFLATVHRINRELGTTVVMSEHRLEEVYGLADRVVVMEEGRVTADGEPRAVAGQLHRAGSPMALALPAAARIAWGVEGRLGRRSGEGAPCDRPDCADGEGAPCDRPGRRSGEGAPCAPPARAVGRGAPCSDSIEVQGSSRVADVSVCTSMNCARTPLPTARAYSAMVEEGTALQVGTPLTVREGRAWLTREVAVHPPRIRVLPEEKVLDEAPARAAVELKDVWFRYERDGADVLRGTTLAVPEGSLFAVVGGNGTGKSTMLRAICGVARPYRGKITVLGRRLKEWKKAELFRGGVALLPQDPLNLMVKKTVRGDLEEMLDGRGLTAEQRVAAVREVAVLTDIVPLLDAHPFDLSGGEVQRAALAKVLLSEPRLLLLDEPTKGLDAFFKDKLARLLRSLTARGTTVLMVSHDVEFCASYADWCALFFDGNVVTTNPPRQFFASNSFYTTAANRISRGFFENVVTVEEVVELCRS
ncbi:ABC transporter ATP-binding protein [uncultured Adlercreutzia sp.]|uniref:ABC transporter ATP-binding protein n=1 Tax=uncultured Adlercreutzia sp. TaxID=875803 RepID=UPI0026662A0F|nr:ATP-binding cassette domain-containing protein [uncultured Adlercreutzia sp.]